MYQKVCHEWDVSTLSSKSKAQTFKMITAFEYRSHRAIVQDGFFFYMNAFRNNKHHRLSVEVKHVIENERSTHKESLNAGEDLNSYE